MKTTLIPAAVAATQSRAVPMARTWELFHCSFLGKTIPWRAIAADTAQLLEIAKNHQRGPLMARQKLRLPKREQPRAAIKPARVMDASGIMGYAALPLASVRKTGYLLNWEVVSSVNRITCLSTDYLPIIFTARDEHSVGQPIGCATLSGRYASTALDLDYFTPGTAYDLHNLRISHASTTRNGSVLP